MSLKRKDDLHEGKNSKQAAKMKDHEKTGENIQVCILQGQYEKCPRLGNL